MPMPARVALFGFAVVALLTGCASSPGAPVDLRVDVGGHRLRAHCLGQGQPTVVIDTGVGETYESWLPLMESLAQGARVCSYDRAGYGRSEPGPMPRDAERAAGELHRLLLDSGQNGPFLLVGHSLGALNLQVFAARYPDQVAGLVLLDPSPRGWLTGDNFPELRAMFRQETAVMRGMADEASVSSSASERKRTPFLNMVASEHEQLLERTARQLAAIDTFGGIPLTVIASTEPNPAFGASAEAFQQYWIEESRRLAAMSENGRFILAEGSGHHIHLDAPDVVIDAIREMLAAAADEHRSIARAVVPLMRERIVTAEGTTWASTHRAS
jgi:pimeloyl-ACP methyl ester carboxylesterase